jgi:hypothetical protein
MILEAQVAQAYDDLRHCKTTGGSGSSNAVAKNGKLPFNPAASELRQELFRHMVSSGGVLRLRGADSTYLRNWLRRANLLLDPPKPPRRILDAECLGCGYSRVESANGWEPCVVYHPEDRTLRCEACGWFADMPELRPPS